jgi:hypothetical protein
MARGRVLLGAIHAAAGAKVARSSRCSGAGPGLRHDPEWVGVPPTTPATGPRGLEVATTSEIALLKTAEVPGPPAAEFITILAAL